MLSLDLDSIRTIVDGIQVCTWSDALAALDADSDTPFAAVFYALVSSQWTAAGSLRSLAAVVLLTRSIPPAAKVELLLYIHTKMYSCESVAIFLAAHEDPRLPYII